MPVCIEKIVAIDVVVNEQKEVIDGVETVKEDTIQVFVRKPSTVSLVKKMTYLYRMYGADADKNKKEATDAEIEYTEDLKEYGLSAIVGFKKGDVLIGNDDTPLIGDFIEENGKFVAVANPTPKWRDKVRELLPEVTTAVGKYLVTDSSAKVKRKN